MSTTHHLALSHTTWCCNLLGIRLERIAAVGVMQYTPFEMKYCAVARLLIDLTRATCTDIMSLEWFAWFSAPDIDLEAGNHCGTSIHHQHGMARLASGQMRTSDLSPMCSFVLIAVSACGGYCLWSESNEALADALIPASIA